MRIAQEQEAQRASEASSGVSRSGILGYGKGKAPEKHICTNCLRKGIECKWDEGDQGESKNVFFLLVPIIMIGTSCQPCWNSKI